MRPAAPPAAASPLGWLSGDPLQTVEDASRGQSSCTGLSKIYKKQEHLVSKNCEFLFIPKLEIFVQPDNSDLTIRGHLYQFMSERTYLKQ